MDTSMRVPAVDHPGVSAAAVGAMVLAVIAYVMLGAGWRPWPHDLALPSVHHVAPTVVAAAADVDGNAVASAAQRLPVAVAGAAGVLVARDAHYRARFDRDGFVYTPTGATKGLRVSLADARRGADALPLAIGAWHVDGTGTVRDVAEGVREVVHTGDGSVEWDVVLAHTPSGIGDFVVGADVAGATSLAARDGAVAVTLAGGAHMRIGAIVVKDADGRVVYRALPVVHGDRLELVVPGRVLAGARYPLTVDPTVGGEAVVSNATANQTQAAVASDGTNSLVVWADSRNGDLNSDIYGARVNASGTVLDPGGFPISTAAGGQLRPAVAYYGPNYLVVWDDQRNDSGDIYAARVTTGGVVLDTGGAAFCTMPGTQQQPDVDVDAAGALVVWTDYRNDAANPDIYGTRWTVSAGVPNVAGFPISTAVGVQQRAAVAYTGSNYLAVWEDRRNDPSFADIYGARVTTSSSVLDPTGAVISTAARAQTSPDIAWNGSTGLIVWEDDRNGGGPGHANRDIFGTRWTVAGGVVDAGGLAIANQPWEEADPAVAANGDFLVAWQDRRVSSGGQLIPDIYARRMSANGAFVDANPFLVSGAAGTDQQVAVAKQGTKWITGYDRNGDLFARTVSPK